MEENPFKMKGESPLVGTIGESEAMRLLLTREEVKAAEETKSLFDSKY